MQNDMKVISVYSRAQAIEDGELVDVTTAGKEAGFGWPVALTRSAWMQCVEVPEGVSCQDEAGRLWDVLWMLRCEVNGKPTTNPLHYHLFVRTEEEGPPQAMCLKATSGPGDTPEPVITIMLPHED